MNDDSDLRLFDPPADDEPIVTVTGEAVLRTWGRTHNHLGPKPATFRRVRRTVVEEVTERYCSACDRYLSLDLWKSANADRCRECLSARWKAESSDPQRRERMRWAAHRQRAAKVGAPHDITVEEWLILVGSWESCAAPECDGPFERVDHIVSFTAGGANTATNLQPLCRRHHAEKTRAERAADASRVWDQAAS